MLLVLLCDRGRGRRLRALDGMPLIDHLYMAPAPPQSLSDSSSTFLVVVIAVLQGIGHQ